jgi:hypothetical protein
MAPPRSRFMNLAALLSSTQDCRHDAGAAATMNYRDHNDRLFVRRISNKEVVHNLKSQWMRSEV